MGVGRYVPGRLVRLGVILAFFAGVAALPAAAHGDVSATVDAAGDLWIFGDSLANGVRVDSGGDDEDVFRIRGLDAATTVNGLLEVTLVAPGSRMVVFLGDGDNQALFGDGYGSSPSCCRRELLVVCGGGADRIVLVGPFERVTADLGPGDDSLEVTEGSLGVSGSLVLGAGDDVLAISAFTAASGTFDLGPGSDQLVIGEDTAVDGTIELGPGDDFLWMTENAGDVELRGGDGDDTFELERFAAGALELVAGAGADDVRLTGDRSSSWSGPIDPLSVDLGADDDRLAVGNAEVGSARFDGGSGTDSYLDLGGNSFAQGAPELRGFEIPKASRGPVLERRTTLAGRVVDEHGAPVPDARVALPQRALATTTDAAGEFVFGPLEEVRAALEVVAGATLHGRERSGAVLAELEPLGTTRVGDVVLEPTRRNVALFGAPLYRASAIEANLLALGRRQEQVSNTGTLPAELAPYGAVWHVGGTIAPAERERLGDFVRAGGGLFLSGAGSNDHHSALEALLAGLVDGGGIDLGARGSAASGLHSFQPGAAGGIASVPNSLVSFQRSAFSRFVTGLAPRNELVVMSTSADVPAAVWDARDLSGRRGRIVLVMDSTWMVAGESLDVLENLQAFLERAPRFHPGR